MSREAVRIDIDDVQLDATLSMPQRARGLVLLADGGGRLSPHNQRIAQALEVRSIASLLLELHTPEESGDAANAGDADVDALARRLAGVAAWARRDPRTAALPPCYFGAGTVAAAALIATARAPAGIIAVVSHCGRPDLASAVLHDVRVPTLLIVGSDDEDTLARNRAAIRLLAGPSQLVIAPGGAHQSSSAAGLDVVARLAADWLLVHFGLATMAGASVV